MSVASFGEGLPKVRLLEPAFTFIFDKHISISLFNFNGRHHRTCSTSYPSGNLVGGLQLVANRASTVLQENYTDEDNIGPAPHP